MAIINGDGVILTTAIVLLACAFFWYVIDRQRRINGG